MQAIVKFLYYVKFYSISLMLFTRQLELFSEKNTYVQDIQDILWNDRLELKNMNVFYYEYLVAGIFTGNNS